MDFTDGPLAAIVNLPGLHSGCVGPCGCWGKGGTWRPLSPPGTPRGQQGQGLGQNVALVQGEARKMREMRSLPGGGVGCDTGEEQGAIVTLQSKGKTSCGDGRSPPAHARPLGFRLSGVTWSGHGGAEGTGRCWRPGGIHGRSQDMALPAAPALLGESTAGTAADSSGAQKQLENSWGYLEQGSALRMDLPCAWTCPEDGSTPRMDLPSGWVCPEDGDTCPVCSVPSPRAPPGPGRGLGALRLIPHPSSLYPPSL